MKFSLASLATLALSLTADASGVHRCVLPLNQGDRPLLPRGEPLTTSFGQSSSMKLQKMPASAHESSTLEHLTQQTQALQQKYLGRQGLGMGSNANSQQGYGYPPSRADVNIQMVEEHAHNDLIAEGGHGVPLSNFLNA